MNKRNSIQKQMISSALSELCHPTASDIYEHIRTIYPNISLATIYRNLGYMCEDKQIIKISFPNEADRYDPFENSHYHAICTQCGGVYDIKNISEKLMNNIDDHVEESTGFKVNMHSIYFSGICSGCRKAEKKD